MPNPSVVKYVGSEGPPSGGTQVNGVSATFASKTTAGNSIVALYTLSDYAGIHNDVFANDTQGNTYTLVARGDTNPAGGAQSMCLFLAPNIAGDLTAPATCTTQVGQFDTEDYQANLFIEVTGVLANPIVGYAGQAQNNLAPGSGNIQSGLIYVPQSQVPAILIGGCMNTSVYGTPTQPTVTGTGMTQITGMWAYGSGNPGACAAYQLITSTGYYQAVFNQASDDNEDIAVVAAILQGQTLPSIASIAWING